MKSDKRAVALKKRSERIKVIGKGRGYIARVIVEFAKKHDIPIQEDATLVERLFEVDLYEDVPDELYDHVVKVLNFLYNIKNG